MSALPRRPQGNRSIPIPASPLQFCPAVSGRASRAPGSTIVLLRWRRHAPSRPATAPGEPPLAHLPSSRAAHQNHAYAARAAGSAGSA
ncbi:MAG: hypothetical protein B9S26_14505 [Opitutia bacterium Tous-C4FEB]|nr:MAG: hypothetical protein B9S26_14505 [Opitutae bacterium Tous-C4FEB]